MLNKIYDIYAYKQLILFSLTPIKVHPRHMKQDCQLGSAIWLYPPWPELYYSQCKPALYLSKCAACKLWIVQEMTIIMRHILEALFF